MNGNLFTFDEFRANVEEDLNGFVTQVCLDVNNRVPSPSEMEAMGRFRDFGRGCMVAE